MGLTEADRARLAELRPVIEGAAEDLVEGFYRHLLAFEHTREMLADSKVRERLLHSQRAYLLSLWTARLDDEYVSDRRRIGEVHYRIGLAPRWYFGAYAHYISLIGPLVREHYADDPERAMDAMVSLSKLFMLDAQLAMESYVESGEENLGNLARELAESGRGMARKLDEQRLELQQTTARARAAEALASVGTMAAGIAHEIGTPMSVIRGHAELLQDAVSGPAEARVETIIEQIDRISNVMQGLLNLARPQAPRRAPVDLAAVMDTALSFLREKIRRRGIEVERDFGPQTTVTGDADKIQQLFLNLILNAVDAMGEGGYLRVRVGSAGPRELEVIVEDDGVGIPEEDVEHIFDPFFTSKPAGEGNGLGLVVAQGIAGDHGGHLEVSSQLGEGTSVRAVLPI